MYAFLLGITATAALSILTYFGLEGFTIQQTERYDLPSIILDQDGNGAGS